MARVRVELLAHAPTEFFHCQHCEVAFHELGLGRRFRAEQRAAALPPDLRASYARLSDWLGQLITRYGDRVQVDVIDVGSLEGFFLALRHRVRRYPTLIIDGRVTCPAEDLSVPTRLIEQRLQRREVLPR